MRGTIKTLTNRGFGFISVAGADAAPARDYFFHLSALQNRPFEVLEVGDQVEFVLGSDRKGRVAAEQVNVV
jgi:cold shock CspA family protein